MMADRYWPSELDKQLKIIAISRKLMNWNQDYFQHRLNKAILLSAVALRNSIDLSQVGLDRLPADHKIRQEYNRVKNYQLQVMEFSKEDGDELFSELIDPYNWGKGSWASLTAREVTNRIIHSCVWQWVNTTGNTNMGFLCTSYRKQDTLLFVPLDEWVGYIQEGKKYSRL